MAAFHNFPFSSSSLDGQSASSDRMTHASFLDQPTIPAEWNTKHSPVDIFGRVNKGYDMHQVGGYMGVPLLPRTPPHSPPTSATADPLAHFTCDISDMTMGAFSTPTLPVGQMVMSNSSIPSHHVDFSSHLNDMTHHGIHDVVEFATRSPVHSHTDVHFSEDLDHFLADNATSAQARSTGNLLDDIAAHNMVEYDGDAVSSVGRTSAYTSPVNSPLRNGATTPVTTLNVKPPRKEREFPCKVPYCNRTFKSPTSLRLHERVHEAVVQELKDYTCSECHKGFNTQSELNTHMTQHEGAKIKPHHCDYPGCGKSFARKGELKMHRFIHAGVKPHVCPEPGCGKRFIRRSDLKTHSRVHTGERPYACGFPGCHHTSTTSSNLRKHQRLHKTKDGK
eukprot:GFYU01002530.1.p1 GENE.GFYU01002530.1~~GFYU01002530.1.p1  ORF type:complete len:392 (+),score=120.90 GFYU01002530.1:212-1387(+)